MTDRLARHGGSPVRTEPFEGPRHNYGDADVQAVAEVIHSEFKTSKREDFEELTTTEA